MHALYAADITMATGGDMVVSTCACAYIHCLFIYNVEYMYMCMYMYRVILYMFITCCRVIGVPPMIGDLLGTDFCTFHNLCRYAENVETPNLEGRQPCSVCN